MADITTAADDLKPGGRGRRLWLSVDRDRLDGTDLDRLGEACRLADLVALLEQQADDDWRPNGQRSPAAIEAERTQARLDDMLDGLDVEA